MAAWFPIENAPWQRPVRVKTEKGAELVARRDYDVDLVDDDGNPARGWFAVIEGTAPPCWADDICRYVGEDGKRSDWPEFWREEND